MKKILIILVIVLVILTVVILIIGRTFYPDNVAETSPNGSIKQLTSRYYATDVATAAKNVEEIIPTLSSWGGQWKLIENKIEGTSATIKVEIPVVVFTDDLTVTIKTQENSESVKVDVRSSSRVGKSDFGENRRHVIQLLEAIDKKFGNAQDQK
jgi:uncharacterized protein (DUF1499 family)